MDEVATDQVLEDLEGGCAPCQGVTFLPLHADAGLAQPPALEGLEGPSSAVPLFVVPVVMKNRREISSPARAAGSRHLERQRLRAAVIALIRRHFVRLLGGTWALQPVASAQGFQKDPGGLWLP